MAKGNVTALRQVSPSRVTNVVKDAAANERTRPRAALGNPSPLPDAYTLGRPLVDAEIAQRMDRRLNANLARLTAGVAPRALAMAFADWWVHLATSPGRQLQLLEKASRKAHTLSGYAARCQSNVDQAPCIEPLPQDKRFVSPGWQQWPFNLMHQSFLLTQQWWHNATTGVQGVAKRNEEIVEFAVRQMLDVFSPANNPLTNPEVLQATAQQGGMNLVKGIMHFFEDWQAATQGQRPAGSEEFTVGENVAGTPGKVVFRNRLIELIQYAPTTDNVYAEPVLIVPAWIMKYYILDLSTHNSLVKYLVAQGHTVFMVSWHNPSAEDRDLGMDDYRRLGVMAALDAVSNMVPNQPIHAVGYCLGGTLLSIAAAAMARDGDDRLKTLTLLATQLDFTEAGELMLFVNEGQIAFLESMMWDQGYLDTKQMAGAFQMLRSNDLIWSRVIREYLLGERSPLTDLMFWNADKTRMPYRMHSEYLRDIFLNNDFAQGRYKVADKPVTISDIRIPIFAVGTVKDHVVPWRSAYKIHLLSDAKEVTFLLTSGGHNAGIVSEPGHPRRRFQVTTVGEGDTYVDPDTWQAQTPTQPGSWWPMWDAWLVDRSGGRRVKAPRTCGAPGRGFDVLDDAPGTYVLEP